MSPFRLIGKPRLGGTIVVADHAANQVPGDIDLGIDPALLDQHIAVDIGVSAVAELLARQPEIAAHCATHSRLVCDLNREEHSAEVLPTPSDGHAIPGNCWTKASARPGWSASTAPITTR